MQESCEYLIIGAGPAGLQLGYFLRAKKRDYLILERDSSAGAFFKKFPRHDQLISINKVHTGIDNPQANLRWDWNSLLCDNPDLLFKNYSSSYFPQRTDLVRYCEDFAAHYELNIKYGTNIEKVSKVDGQFQVRDTEGKVYTGKRLVVATGLFKSMIPDIPGIEHCEDYSVHETNPDHYTNKRVLVVGKGNSAFETADNLVEKAAAIHILSPESVKFAWQTHFVGNLRAVNNNFLDTYQLKSQNTVIDADIVKVEKEGEQCIVHISYCHAKGQTAVIPYDHVILCTGFRMDDSIFDDSCRPELMHHGKVPSQTVEWESKNVPDMYFAGTLMQACDFKKTMSGFIHGFRHNIQTLAEIFEHKYHGATFSREKLELDPEVILKKVIDQVNISPGIFLQPGFLCDVVVVSEEEDAAYYYSDVRRDYVAEGWLGQHDHYYTVSLEYGHFMENPFATMRDPDPEMGHDAPYLHPVIRRFQDGEVVAEHHINDDLESQWFKEIYVKPARAFFVEQLSPSADVVTQ